MVNIIPNLSHLKRTLPLIKYPSAICTIMNTNHSHRTGSRAVWQLWITRACWHDLVTVTIFCKWICKIIAFRAFRRDDLYAAMAQDLLDTLDASNLEKVTLIRAFNGQLKRS